MESVSTEIDIFCWRLQDVTLWLMPVNKAPDVDKYTHYIIYSFVSFPSSGSIVRELFYNSTQLADSA